jgi:signal transduction histidine kinase
LYVRLRLTLPGLFDPSKLLSVTRVGFRGRLFAILLLFALVPAVVLSLVWAGTGQWAAELIGGGAAWDSVVATGQRAIGATRQAPLDSAAAVAVAVHDTNLKQSLARSRQAAYVYGKIVPRLVAVAALVMIAVFAFFASNVAGHFSRSMSRPLQEIVGWTALIGRGDPLPEGPPKRGAPEFDVLRDRMRVMAAELKLGRALALEAERAAALRESARQVAHELKNPLTPIRFAVDRLRAGVPPHLRETVDVLAVESARLEEMARSFAQFGRLPEGPKTPTDLVELARYTARSTVPPGIDVAVEVAADTPMVEGHYEALARAFSNVMLNAADACSTAAEQRGAGARVGTITVHIAPVAHRGTLAVEVTVRDTGCGIAPERLERIWDPYVTTKPGGTGLGLAIVRQTILAHDGAVSAESEPGLGTTIRLVIPTGGDHGTTAKGTQTSMVEPGTVQIPLLRSKAGLRVAQDDKG